MSALRVITVAGDPQQEAELASRLGSFEVEIILRCVERSEVLAAIRTGVVDGMILVGAASWVDGQCVAEARAAGIRIAAIPRDRVDVEHFLGLGVAALPTASGCEEVLAALEPLREAPGTGRELATGSSRPGRIFAVWGPKGAPGRSTIAIELAAAMASVEPLTLLIDGDPYGGDLKQLLGVVDDVPSVVWAAREAAKGTLDRTAVAAELRRAGRDGPVLLPGLPRADLWADVTSFGWSELLERSREIFRNVVVDVGFCLEPGHLPGFDQEDGRNRMARSTVAVADRVIAVMGAEPVGIKNMAMAMSALDEIVEAERVSVVANRLRSGLDREVAALTSQHVKRGLFATIPYAPADVSEAVSSGRTIAEQVPGSRVTAAVREVAAKCGAPIKPRGLLHRLGGRSR